MPDEEGLAGEGCLVETLVGYLDGPLVDEVPRAGNDTVLVTMPRRREPLYSQWLDPVGVGERMVEALLEDSVVGDSGGAADRSVVMFSRSRQHAAMVGRDSGNRFQHLAIKALISRGRVRSSNAAGGCSKTCCRISRSYFFSS